MVTVRVVDKTDFTLGLIIQGTNVAFLNTLRRIMLTEVPSMAVDEVMVIENSSVLPDEVLAHRLGFIPLKTDLETYNLPEECPCKSELGCNLCRVSLALDVEATESVRTIYSGDLVTENPDIRPVKDNIPIVKLAPDQKIKLEAYARLGKGKTHAKWQPVSVCTYKHLPKIEIDANRCDTCGNCVEVCPMKILQTTGRGIQTQNIIECALCRDCVDACPLSPPAVDITLNENSFIFHIESTGSFLVEQIFRRALQTLEKKLEEFLNQLMEKFPEEPQEIKKDP